MAFGVAGPKVFTVLCSYYHGKQFYDTGKEDMKSEGLNLPCQIEEAGLVFGASRHGANKS